MRLGAWHWANIIRSQSQMEMDKPFSQLQRPDAM